MSPATASIAPNIGWWDVARRYRAGASSEHCRVVRKAALAAGDAVGAGIGTAAGLFGFGGTDDGIGYLLTGAKVGHLVAGEIGVDWGWFGTAVAGGQAYHDRVAH